MDELTPAQRKVIKRIEAIQKEDSGHGTLRVEIRDRKISLIKREHSEKVEE
jgi:hypothetical protein